MTVSPPTDAAGVGRHDPYAALRVPAFRWFIGSLVVMTLAVQIQAVVIAWQVYAITRDPLSLGMVGLAEALPYIACALWAGHVVDRGDRRRIALAAIATLVACSMAFLALTLADAVRTRAGLVAIYAVVIVSGLARSFLQPARVAIGASLVPRALLATSVAWRSSTWQAAAVLGPATGGLLYGFAGARASYAADVALMVLALAAFTRVAYVPPPRDDGRREPIRESLLSGMRYVRGQPVVLGALSLDLFAVFFGGAIALLPVFADEILRVGPQGLGMLRAAPAAGAVAMSLLLAHRRPMEHAGRALIGSVFLFGACIIGFALSKSVWLSLLLLAASGAADMVSVVVRSTLVQVFTPTHLLGRVSSVNSIFIGSSNEIGAFESGVAARLLGTVPSVVFGGVMTIATVGLVAWLVPSLRRLGRLDAPPPT